jgi:hypothetical protein
MESGSGRVFKKISFGDEVEENFFKPRHGMSFKEFADLGYKREFNSLAGALKIKDRGIEEFYKLWGGGIASKQVDKDSGTGFMAEKCRKELCQMTDDEGDTLLIIAAKYQKENKSFHNLLITYQSNPELRNNKGFCYHDYVRDLAPDFAKIDAPLVKRRGSVDGADSPSASGLSILFGRSVEGSKDRSSSI